MQQKSNSYKKIDQILYHQNSFFMLKTIYIKFISRYKNDFLVDYFRIEKTYKLLAYKYY